MLPAATRRDRAYQVNHCPGAIPYIKPKKAPIDVQRVLLPASARPFADDGSPVGLARRTSDPCPKRKGGLAVKVQARRIRNAHIIVPHEIGVEIQRAADSPGHPF